MKSTLLPMCFVVSSAGSCICCVTSLDDVIRLFIHVSYRTISVCVCVFDSAHSAEELPRPPFIRKWSVSDCEAWMIFCGGFNTTAPPEDGSFTNRNEPLPAALMHCSKLQMRRFKLVFFQSLHCFNGQKQPPFSRRSIFHLCVL